MQKYIILCVDDEREVLDSVVRDLEKLSAMFTIEPAESVEEAKAVLAQIQRSKQKPALIFCDHMMPGITGAEFLIELNQNEFTRATRKVLLTGQAGLDATVLALNQGGLHYYVAKPWTVESLMQVAVAQLTTYIIEYEPDLISYAKLLDAVRIFNAIHERVAN
ncbi:response regulator [Deltaproteobacteria bacterium TL4]